MSRPVTLSLSLSYYPQNVLETHRRLFDVNEHQYKKDDRAHSRSKLSEQIIRKERISQQGNEDYE